MTRRTSAEPLYTLTNHARRVIEERKIHTEWINRTLERPQRTERDRHDPNLNHALAPIPEFGDRVLRVVYNKTDSPWKIVTAYFDRTMKDKL